MIEDIRAYDKDFTEEKFISKVNQLYLMIIDAIKEEDIESIEYCVSPPLYRQLLAKYEDYTIQDDVSILDTKIVDIQLTGYFITIIVEMKTKWNRKTKKKIITVTKYNNRNNPNVITICPFCRHEITREDGNKCPSCGQITDMQNYDYLITRIEEKKKA